MVTVKDIIRQYLEREGFDGLCCEECGCSTSTLYCCDEFDENCIPARRVPRVLDRDACEFANVTAEEAAELWRKDKEKHDENQTPHCV